MSGTHIQNPNLVIVVFNHDGGHQGDGRPGDEKVLPESDATAGTTPSSSGSDTFNYLQGWRKVAATTGLVLGIFLVIFELAITSTALVSITDDLESFDQSSWIATAYLCTYIAGLSICASLSDFFGRKKIIVVSLAIFAVFSGGCGAAQTTVQLIVCRAFQGVGAAGQYATGITAIYELVPPRKLPKYATLVLVSVAVSWVIGPILGGLIVRSGDWRWIFLLNCPACVVAGALVVVGMPSDFPYQAGPLAISKPAPPSFRSFDLLGVVLLVAALVLLTTGLNEAAASLDWASGRVLGSIIGAAAAALAFFTWEWHATRPKGGVRPLFPWRFVQSRPMLGMLANCVCTGVFGVGVVFQIPQRYQTAVGLSPLDAGIRIIPYSASGALGSALAATLCKKERVPAIYVALAGSAMEIVGFIFLARGDEADPDWRGLLGLQAVVGVGYGACMAMQSLLTPPIAGSRDLATATGATVQARFLGGAVAVSVLNAVANRHVLDRVAGVLTPGQIAAMFASVETIGDLPPPLRELVRRLWVRAFNVEMYILLGVAVVSLLTIGVMWQRRNIRVA